MTPLEMNIKSYFTNTAIDGVLVVEVDGELSQLKVLT
jgi:hypothetical protein